jgi:hypothetical protein
MLFWNSRAHSIRKRLCRVSHNKARAKLQDFMPPRPPQATL